MAVNIPTSKRNWPTWLIVVIVLLSVFNGLPFLAPVFMKLGWELPGRAIYFVYGFLCHQMAQRSFFLFGPEGFQMYGISDLPVKATGPLAELTLRQFLGNESLGWKVAWSDRTVSMFGTPLLVAIAYAVMRRWTNVKPLAIWAFPLFLLPMILDGGIHMISDVMFGIGHGFRDNNEWLAILTAHKFPALFYSGDGLGSFNSWMRLLSGVALGIGVGWLAYPWMDYAESIPTPQEMSKSSEPLQENWVALSALPSHEEAK